MSFLKCVLLYSFMLTVWSATHDELPQCGLAGIYKARQSVIESPNYPDNYPPNTCWDYVIRSPYRCPTKFHIQFLDFALESSRDCSHDYLAVGLQNDDNDMDVLCGQVIGIKKYHTPDGILRLRFYTDDSPWSTAKGFKLLITRLACEREDVVRGNDDDDTEEINAPPLQLQLPHQNLPEIFRNITATDQYQPLPLPPVFAGVWNRPQYPVPPPPPTGFGGLYLPIPQRPQHLIGVSQSAATEKPCTPTQTNLPVQQQFYAPQQGYRSNEQLTASRSNTPQIPQQQLQQIQQLQQNLLQQQRIEDQQRQLLLQQQQQQQGQKPQKYLQTTPNIKNIDPIILKQLGPQLSLPLADPCCSTSFHQKHFYLSSPGFPRTAFTSLLPAQQRDCHFYMEKSSQSVCRLRIEFKFFDFGQTYGGGTSPNQANIDVAIGTTKDVCTEDFLEIDNERFCGCRTGYVFNSVWELGKKTMRMRLGYSGIPSSGFLLELFQEECSPGELLQPQLPGQSSVGLNNPQIVAGFGGVQNDINGLPSFIGQQNGFLTPQQQINLLQEQQQLQQQQQFGLLQQQQFPLYQPGLIQQQSQQQPYQPLLNNPNLIQAQQPQQFWGSLSNQFPQFRQAKTLDYAKAASSQQPVSVVETNSTRKEIYYFDGDEAFMQNRYPADEPDNVDRADLKVYEQQPRNRCTFDMMDIFRLSVDSLWLTRPTCYTPIRNWFNNFFG